MRLKASLASRLQCVLLLLVVARTAAAGGIIYVDAVAAGANNGSSWENAYNYLQDALVDAETAEKPVEIQVSQGIYKPDQGVNHTLGDREATFQLINNVMLKGGYAGLGEPDTNARDIELYETILSGDLNGNDIQVDDPCDLHNEPSRAENSYHVVTGSDTDETAMLDGFTIADGSDDSETGPGGVMWSCGYGGGLYNLEGSPTLISCTFSNNLASASGGGMYNETGNPTLTNCIFRRNSSEICGGGMYNYTSNLTLTNCTFSDNFAGINGGGMANIYSETMLTNCTFSENFSRNEAGGMDNEYSSSTLSNCTFFANSTLVSGGGICNSTRKEACIITLLNCSFIQNSAMFAGGMMNHVVNPKLANCTFIENSAIDGGGIYNNSSNPIMTNCTFSCNSAQWGGAIENRYSSPTLDNCIISSNSATYGSGTNNLESNLTITNCTFTQNSAQYGNTLSCDSSPRQGSFPSNFELNNCILWNGGNEIWNNNASTIDITYSNVQGGWSGKGNIELDPCFAQPGYWDPNGTADDPNDDFWVDGDYHLKSQAGRWNPVSEIWVVDDVTSPCIDAGDPNSPVAFEPFPNGGIINMGAYGGTAEASISLSGIHSKYGGGSGTTEDPYLIYTAEQMNKIGLYQEDWHRHFKLMMDINLIDFKSSLYNIIGNEYYPFKGTFDGNGHTISNFTYSSTNSSWIGIFGYVSEPNACIKKLGLIDPNIYVRHISTVGSLAGGLYTGIITNCYVTNSNISAEGFVGGLVGQNLGVVSDCHVNGTITGIYRVGGLIGVNQSISRDGIDKRSGVVQRCYSQASISGQSEVGGLVGYNGEGTITDCSSTIDITGKNGIGGLVGVNSGLIENCYSHGSLEAQKEIGGLIGVNDGIIRSSYSDISIEGGIIVGGLVGENYSGEIINCYARGDITGNSFVGGLVGSNTVTKSGHIIIVRSGTVQNCYSTAVVSGDWDTGGFVGRNEEDGISNSFWDIETSRLTTSYGGEGKTTVEMQTISTFLGAGWDFVDETANGTGDIWWILEGQDYPRLWWELIIEE